MPKLVLAMLHLRLKVSFLLVDTISKLEILVRAKQLAEIDALMKEKGMGELDPEQTKMYLE